MLPNLPEQAKHEPDSWRKDRFYVKEIADALAEHTSELRFVYVKYSAINPQPTGRKGQISPRFSVDEWRQLLTETKLLATETMQITLPQVRKPWRECPWQLADGA